MYIAIKNNESNCDDEGEELEGQLDDESFPAEPLDKLSLLLLTLLERSALLQVLKNSFYTFSQEPEVERHDSAADPKTEDIPELTHDNGGRHTANRQNNHVDPLYLAKYLFMHSCLHVRFLLFQLASKSGKEPSSPRPSQRPEKQESVRERF